MLQAKLRVVSGKQEGSEIPLPLGKFLVGREEDCHIRPNSDLVSRHHCVFTLDEFTLRLRDLGSTNGTFVNGERIHGAVVLNRGDRVVIGKLELDISISSGADLDTQLLGATEGNTKLDGPIILPVESPTSVTESNSATLSEVETGSTEFPMPAAAVAPPPQGDTQFYPPNMMPGYQVPVGYPPQYPQYGYPGYPQMPPGYYPQMGYPMPGMQMPPGYPPQGYPAQVAPPIESPSGSGTPASTGLETKLPDPASTGAKAPDQVPGSGGTGGKAAIPNAADQIIKQYMTRR